MEAPKDFRVHQPADRQGVCEGRPGEVVDLNPPHAVEGFLEAAPEPRRNPVVQQRYVETEYSKYGQSQVELFTFENGRQHEVITSEPKVQRSDYPIVMTPALGT